MIKLTPIAVFIDGSPWHYDEWNENNKEDKRKEWLHQKEAYLWAAYHFPELMIFHPINEGDVKVQYRDKLLSCGLVPGVSDLVVLKVSGVHPFACFELKRATKTLASPVSAEQKKWLRRCRADGGYSAVCYGAKAFKQALCHYLGLTLCPDGHNILEHQQQKEYRNDRAKI